MSGRVVVPVSIDAHFAARMRVVAADVGVSVEEFLVAGAQLLMEHQGGIRRALAPINEREAAAVREAATMGDPFADARLTPEHEAAIERQWAALFAHPHLDERHEPNPGPPPGEA